VREVDVDPVLERAINEALSLLEAAGRLLKGTIDTGFDK
jgi:hypothetical protein